MSHPTEMEMDDSAPEEGRSEQLVAKPLGVGKAPPRQSTLIRSVSLHPQSHHNTDEYTAAMTRALAIFDFNKCVMVEGGPTNLHDRPRPPSVSKTRHRR